MHIHIYLLPIHDNICMGAVIGTEVVILAMITAMLLQKTSSKRYPHYTIQIPRTQISLEAGSYLSYMFIFSFLF